MSAQINFPLIFAFLLIFPILSSSNIVPAPSPIQIRPTISKNKFHAGNALPFPIIQSGNARAGNRNYVPPKGNNGSTWERMASLRTELRNEKGKLRGPILSKWPPSHSGPMKKIEWPEYDGEIEGMDDANKEVPIPDPLKRGHSVGGLIEPEANLEGTRKTIERLGRLLQSAKNSESAENVRKYYDEELAKKLSLLSRSVYLRKEMDEKEYLAEMQRRFYGVFRKEDGWEFKEYCEKKCGASDDGPDFKEYWAKKLGIPKFVWDLKSWKKKLGLRDESIAFFWAICEKKRELVLSFRGTTSVGQLLSQLRETLVGDVHFDHQTNHHVKVNGYFKRAHDLLWKEKIEKILKEYKDYKITLTGHSLGGALATLAAMDAVHSAIVPRGQLRVYTFGAPRVGNYEFAKYADELLPNCYRVVYGRDIVPHLPFCKSEPFPGFPKLRRCRKGATDPYHNGTEIWYKSGMHDGHYKRCRDEDPRCSNSWEFAHFLLRPYNLSHHHDYFHFKSGAKEFLRNLTA